MQDGHTVQCPNFTGGVWAGGLSTPNATTVNDYGGGGTTGNAADLVIRDFRN